MSNLPRDALRNVLEPTDGGRPSLESLMADQRRRCAEGAPFGVEEYLGLHPTLRDDAEGLLDLIYNEVVLREQRGEPFALEEYQARFPTLAGPLGDLFEVHRAIDSNDEPVMLSAADTSHADTGTGEETPVLMPATRVPGQTGPADSGVVWPALEGYEIIEVIGSGGMGIVFRANDRRRGVTVAVKTMQRVDGISIYRFKQEFRALLDVSHPNLIALHELISDGRSWFIVMEFVRGVDFLSYVRRGAEPRVRLRSALRQLAEGLAALHRAGKLHRDIKPSNVLVTHEGRVVIMDFGLATEQTRGDSMDGQIIGTAAYMAPEQAAGLPTSEASDWYSVGVMLFEALTGRLPFVGRTIDVLMDKQRFEPAPPHELLTDVPEDLDALCVELLRRDPCARPPGHEVVRRLGGSGAEGAVPETVSSSQAGDAPFVGREPQYQALNDALSTVARGASVVVFVRGRSGVGKSALVQRFLDELVARDAAVVLSGRCYERESVPYKALDSLIDGLSRYLRRLATADVNALLPRDVGALGRVFPVLKRVQALANAPHRGADVPDPQQLRRRAYAALRELLGRLGDRHELVLAIDDLQWGDADSLAVLSEILRPPDPPALLLLASYRTDEENPFLQALAAWSAEEAFDRRLLDVEPLTFDDARVLARKLLGGEGPAVDRQADAVARESGGNPFFVAELARSIQARDGCTGGMALPAREITLDEVLWSRVVRLPDDARRLLEVVAVSGRPLAPGTAWQCVEGGGDERSAVALLRSGRLLRVASGSAECEQVETYHDRIREAVVAHLESGHLREVHGRLALALEGTGRADSEVLGAHWQGAGEPAKAAGHFARAAAQASEALAFDRAAKLYRLVLELGPDAGPEETRRLRAGLGDALANAGRGADAARAYLGACDGATVADQRELRRRAAMQLLISGHIDQGLATLRDVLAAVGMRLPATPRRALASLLFQRARLRLRGLGFRPRDTSEIAAADLTRIDVCWSASIGLSNVDWIRGADFQARGLLLALRAGEPSRIARALTVEAAQTATAGVSVRQRTAILLAKAESLANPEQPYALGMIPLATGISAYLEGRWRDALTACGRAEAVFRDACTGVAWELDTAHAYSLWSLSHLGEWAELARRFPALISEARERGDLYAEMNLSTYILSIVRLAADEPAAAREETARLMGQWSRAGYHVQHNDQVWASLQVELYVGDGVAAWERITRHWPVLSRSLLLRVQFIRTAMLGLRARCALAAAAASGRDVGWLASARRDVSRLEREATPWARAQAALVRAGLAALGKRDAEAITELRVAANTFRAADMGLCAAVAERRLGALIGGDEGRDLRVRADAWMTVQSIRRPDRVAALFAPGLADDAH